MSIAANRYAKALLDLAAGDSDIEGYQEELETVSQIIGAQAGLNAFLHSPQRDRAAKKSLLTDAFGPQVGENILHLLLLLLDKGRIALLPEIASSFAQMADEYRNILNITVTTALPLDSAQIEKIGEKFKALYQGNSVRISVHTDDSLIGGVRVTVGDRLYDGTIRAKLSGMQSAFAGKVI